MKNTFENVVCEIETILFRGRDELNTSSRNISDYGIVFVSFIQTTKQLSGDKYVYFAKDCYTIKKHTK